MVLIDVAPETIAAKRASSPPVLNDRWRESGDWIGFSPATSRTNGKVQILSGRAACSVANHPAGPGSSYRLVSDAIVRSLPESSPLIGWIASCLRLESNQHPRCFRPLLYRLSHRGAVRRTVMGSGLQALPRSVALCVFLPLFRARPEEEAAAAYLIIDRCAYAWRCTKHRAPYRIRTGGTRIKSPLF